MTMKNDTLGDQCKMFEMMKAGEKAMPGLPLLARLDGRAFHTFTRGLDRPYDIRLTNCMINTTKALVEDMHASVGYTQSDEITLLWPGDVEYPFGGRYQKLCSVLAGLASAAFLKEVQERLPAKAEQLPMFDCRVWQVPNPQRAIDVFVWREDDATKNSVAMAAQSLYSSKDLHGQGRADQMNLLMAKGVNWNNYPPYFKRGTYVRRTVEERELTAEELARIPEKHRPTGPVKRGVLTAIKMPPIRKVTNAFEVLFEKAEPESLSGDAS